MNSQLSEHKEHMARAEHIHSAALELTAGGIVAIPTETVYGLAADASNDVAVAKIFAAKRRPADHPLIVHVANAQAIEHFAHTIPTFAWDLIQAFWPGPLTLIVPRRPGAAEGATAGQSSVGLRCPSHPVAQALLLHCQTLGVWGLAAPSANHFGRISPTTSAHVRADFGDSLTVLEGGPCPVGIESTIVDCTRGHPVLLRPGMVAVPELERVLGQKVWRADEVLPSGKGAKAAPKASGTLDSHYAPHAPLYCLTYDELVTRLQAYPQAGTHAVYSVRAIPNLPGQVSWRAMPQDASVCAQELFSALRELDAIQPLALWVERPPNTPLWEGVHDRLRRAATPL